jgi:DNA invertase Pin-like site-specific DNA recombinase
MVGIYCRISGKKEEDKDTSIDTQIEEGIKFADSLKDEYIIYKDIGVSGKAEIEDRDDFNIFIKDIQLGKINHIFAINQSRIERSPKTWQIFVASVLNSGAKWYPAGNLFDLDSTTNRLMANMMSIINEFHSDNTSDAVKKAFKSNALKGKGHGIKAYGITYNKEGFMIHQSEEIKIVKDIFKWSLEGIGAYSIAKKLNEKNIPTRYNQLGLTPVRKEVNTGKSYTNTTKKWWGSTISGILKKEIYKGVHVWGDEKVILPHLAILTEEEFDKVQKNFIKNKKESVGKTPSYKYLLNGLVFCQECGSMIRGIRKVKSRDNSYKCKGKAAPTHICKGSRAINIPKFESFIIHHLFLSKKLQEHLNSIEVDNDEIEVLELKKNQCLKKINTQHKMVTKTFNLMLDEELGDDDMLKSKYKEAKSKLANFKEELINIEDKLKENLDNNKLNRVNNLINGFDVSSGFKNIQKSVQRLIEKIDVSYLPLEKNGIYHFIISYKGFKEKSIWKSNQQLNEFVLVGYQKIIDGDENLIPSFIVPELFEDYMNSSPEKKEFFKSVINDLKNKPVLKGLEGTIQFGHKLDTIVLKELITFN